MINGLSLNYLPYSVNKLPTFILSATKRCQHNIQCLLQIFSIVTCVFETKAAEQRTISTGNLNKMVLILEKQCQACYLMTLSLPSHITWCSCEIRLLFSIPYLTPSVVQSQEYCL